MSIMKQQDDSEQLGNYKSSNVVASEPDADTQYSIIEVSSDMYRDDSVIQSKHTYGGIKFGRSADCNGVVVTHMVKRVAFLFDTGAACMFSLGDIISSGTQADVDQQYGAGVRKHHRLDHPFLRAIVLGEFDPAACTEDELAAAIGTMRFLSYDKAEMRKAVEEFVWHIAGIEDALMRYFSLDPPTVNQYGDEIPRTYSVRVDVIDQSAPILNELRVCYPVPSTAAKLGVRNWQMPPMDEVAFVGNLRLMKHRFERKGAAAWTVSTCKYAAVQSRRARDNAARNGHFAFLEYTNANGLPWDINTCRFAAYGGQLQCLMLLHENGCEWDSSTCLWASNLACLKYAHENGCEWDSRTCVQAACNSRLDCLMYAHENGCEWDSETCSAAASNEGLECLKYAHENGCAWDSMTCAEAACGGDLACLTYAHEQRCAWDGTVWPDTYVRNDLGVAECEQYLRDQGCPPRTQ